MKRKVILISGIVVSAILILVFAGYNINRNSAMFRNLSGHSLGLAQEEELRSEILSQAEQETLKGDGMVPEEVQDAGHTVTELENLPTYEYMQQEIEVYNEGQKIYGIAYIPDTGEEKVPLVVCAHGLGGSYGSNIAYAEQLALHGIVAYCFDFRGGGGSRSDGETTEMSVMTEVSDLEAILSAASSWDFVDRDRIVLLGTSQGGITSAIAAARHTDEVSGLILMYPAFLIGDADGIVPISYSERAVETYGDVEYYVIDGAGHGFDGGDFDEAVRHIFDYLQKIEIIHTAENTEIKIVPESYNAPAEYRETVEVMKYDSAGNTKSAYVYLLHGYEEEKDNRYNILYFILGNSANNFLFY